MHGNNISKLLRFKLINISVILWHHYFLSRQIDTTSNERSSLAKFMLPDEAVHVSFCSPSSRKEVCTELIAVVKFYMYMYVRSIVKYNNQLTLRLVFMYKLCGVSQKKLLIKISVLL